MVNVGICQFMPQGSLVKDYIIHRTLTVGCFLDNSYCGKTIKKREFNGQIMSSE